MRVLIVVDEKELGEIWKSVLEGQGATVFLAHTQQDAARVLLETPIEVVVLNVMLSQGSAFALADLAGYRRPDARVIFVTNSTFFSDGSVFGHVSNARAFVPLSTPPEDLAAMVAHYAAN